MLKVFKFTSYLWQKDLKWISKGPQMYLYGVPMVNPLYVPT